MPPRDYFLSLFELFQTLIHRLSYLQERHHTKVQYQLKSERISLAQVFSKMEQVVEVLGIEDYSVSQTTLDNVSQSS